MYSMYSMYSRLVDLLVPSKRSFFPRTRQTDRETEKFQQGKTSTRQAGSGRISWSFGCEGISWPAVRSGTRLVKCASAAQLVLIHLRLSSTKCSVPT